MSKTCTKCGTIYPATREYFGSTPKGNLRGACRSCVRKRSKEHDALNPNRESKRGAQASDKHFQRISTLLRKQNNACTYCGVSIIGDYEVDHITPLSRDGLDDSTNLQLLCPQCNREKHNKTDAEHKEWRVKVGLDLL